MQKDGRHSCRFCERREFMKTGAALAALMATVPDVGFSGGKKDACKIRLVFSGWGETTPTADWPNIGYDFRPFIGKFVAALDAAVKGVKFLPKFVTTAGDVDKMLADDRSPDSGIAGYLVVQLNPWTSGMSELPWRRDNRNIAALSPDKPVLYTALPYCGDGGVEINTAGSLRRGLTNFAFMMSFRFEDMVGFARAFETLAAGGSTEECVRAANGYRLAQTPAFSGRQPKADALKPVGVDEAMASLRGKKILAFESKRSEEDEAITRDFGVIVERHRFEELNAYWKNASEEDGRRLADEWKKTARKIEGVSEDELIRVARMSLAMRRMMSDRKAAAITVDCLGGCYGGKLGAYPCLGFMECLDDGLVGACECDLRSVISLMVVSALTNGRPGYISDPAVDASRRMISYAHCVSTRRHFGKDSALEPYEILTHSEDRKSASVRTIAPEGYRVTTIIIMPRARLVGLHTAITVGNDPDDRACRTKILAEVEGDFEKLYRHWDLLSWHRVTVYGDIAAQIREWASRIGYKVLEEC